MQWEGGWVVGSLRDLAHDQSSTPHLKADTLSVSSNFFQGAVPWLEASAKRSKRPTRVFTASDNLLAGGLAVAGRQSTNHASHSNDCDVQYCACDVACHTVGE
eukprot:5317379-Amphidinium_carterae.1